MNLLVLQCITHTDISRNIRELSITCQKEHYVDARVYQRKSGCIPNGEYYYQKKVRCHNRQIHKLTILKGGIRKQNQATYLVKGYRLFDKVSYQRKEYFVFGRRKSGFLIYGRYLEKQVNKGSLSCKKLKFIATRMYYLIERRAVDDGRIPPAT